MKKSLSILLSLALICTSSLPAEDYLSEGNDEMNALYSPCGQDDEDKIYTATSNSMVGWGIFLVAAVCLAAGLAHRSAASGH